MHRTHAHSEEAARITQQHTTLKTKLAPVIEYAAVALPKVTKQLNEGLENPHKRATRNAPGTLFRPHLPGYLPYQDRCAALAQLTFNQRITYLTAMFAIKILNNQTQTALHATIAGTICQPRERDQSSQPFIDQMKILTYGFSPGAKLLTNLTLIESETVALSPYTVKSSVKDLVLARV